MSDEPSPFKRIRDAPKYRARTEQLRRSKNPDGTPEAEEPAIKEHCLPSSHQSAILVIDAQSSLPINAVVVPKEVRDIASHAAVQTHNAINANESNRSNALATAIAALREAESNIVISEEAIKEAKVALERARVEII